MRLCVCASVRLCVCASVRVRVWGCVCVWSACVRGVRACARARARAHVRVRVRMHVCILVGSYKSNSAKSFLRS